MHDDRLGVVGRMLHGDVEEIARLLDHPFAKQRAADLHHEIEIVRVAELQRAAEAGHRGVALTELEQRLADSGERVLVIGVEDQRLLEGAASPREILAGMVRVADADVQLDGARI